MPECESMVPFSKVLKHNLELQEYCSKRKAEGMISCKMKASRKRTKQISEDSQSYQKKDFKQTSPLPISSIYKNEMPLPLARNSNKAESTCMLKTQVEGAKKGCFSQNVSHGLWQ